MKYLIESAQFENYQNELLLKNIADWIASLWNTISSYSQDLIFDFFTQVEEELGLDMARIIFLKYDVADLKYWSVERPDYENGVSSKKLITNYLNIRPVVENIMERV